jgi:hypothetical protein
VLGQTKRKLLREKAKHPEMNSQDRQYGGSHDKASRLSFNAP